MSMKEYQDIVSADGNEPAGEWTTALKFKIADCRLQLLAQDSLAIAPSVYVPKAPGMPSCYFIAYEHFAKTTDSLEGALRHFSDLNGIKYGPSKLQWVRVSRSVAYMSLD